MAVDPAFVRFAAIALAYPFLSPVLTLVHEFGHALPALAFTDGPVRVQYGPDPRWTASVGRFTVEVEPTVGWYGFAHTDGSLGRWGGAAFDLGGPLASLLSGVVLLVVGTRVPDPFGAVAWFGAVAAAFNLLVTALPFTYPGWFGEYAGTESDGKRLIRRLRGDLEG